MPCENSNQTARMCTLVRVAGRTCIYDVVPRLIFHLQNIRHVASAYKLLTFGCKHYVPTVTTLGSGLQSVHRVRVSQLTYTVPQS